MYIDKKTLHPRAALKAISDFKNSVRDLSLDEENVYNLYLLLGLCNISFNLFLYFFPFEPLHNF